MKGRFEPVDDKKIYAVSGRVLNALYKLARQWDNLTVEGGKLTKSDHNALLTIEHAEQETGGISMRMIPASLGSIAGDLPSLSEVQTAIEDAYDSAGVAPAAGDIVYMTEFWYLIGGTAVNISEGTVTNNDLFRVVFTVGEVDYVGFGGPARLL